MCGIVIGSGQDWSKERLNKYLEIIKHRGPDNTGSYVDNLFYMGHVRLSIIGTSKNSNQPFFFDKYVVSYNGEMFNYIEERELLIKKGYKFKTDSDTEVIIKMYKEYGDYFIDRVNGMFVISIYNVKSKELFIWRDRFGIKPFYFTITNKGSFIGCSEIKPILLDKQRDDVFWNKNVMASFIKDNIMNYSDETFYTGIKQLKPGYCLKFNTLNSEIKIEEYYSLKQKKEVGYDDIKKILLDSVKLRMRSDVGYSSALSGGVDSTLITRLMQENSKNNGINVFSMLRNSNEDFDTKYSLMYKNRFPQNQYLRVTPDKKELLSILDEVMYYQEEPFQAPSMVLQFLMYKLMKKSGIKVVLEGQGGDEVFVGYERYLFTDNFVNFFFKGGLNRIFNQTGLSKLSSISYWLYFRNSFFRNFRNIKKFGFKTNRILRKYTTSNYISSFTKDLKKGEVRINEIKKFQLRRLLNYGDKNSMANSIEVRLPFLDYRVVEAAISVKQSKMTQNNWSKYFLRKFLSDLDLKDFAWRKNKNGFDTADDVWYIIDLYPKVSSVEIFFNIRVEKITDIGLKWKLANIRALEEIYNVTI